MNVLGIEQLRAVVQLARAHQQLEAASAARDTAEDACRDLGVSNQQIGAILGYTRQHVWRRATQRRDLREVAT